MIISPGAIDLWYTYPLQITDAALIEQYRVLLSPTERERYYDFMFDRHRHRYLVATALTRTVLSLYSECVYGEAVSPAQWQFAANDYGKPFVVDPAPRTAPPLQFSLSYREGMVVLAVTLQDIIGVDVEAWLSVQDPAALVESVFSADERQAFYRLTDQQQRRRFGAIWTLKEAYIKALGVGLSLPLQQLSFNLDDAPDTVAFSSTAGLAAGYQDTAWSFWQMTPNSEHVVALAVYNARHLTYRLTYRDIVPLQCYRENNWPIERQTTCLSF